jgi:hypothetical protein
VGVTPGPTIFRRPTAWAMRAPSKRPSAPYRSGRSTEWPKVKNPDRPPLLRRKVVATPSVDHQDGFTRRTSRFTRFWRIRMGGTAGRPVEGHSSGPAPWHTFCFEVLHPAHRLGVGSGPITIGCWCPSPAVRLCGLSAGGPEQIGSRMCQIISFFGMKS